MGVGGVGMCGLAELLISEGAVVSGCDLAFSERTERLQRLGAHISLGHDPDHIEHADAVVMTGAVAAAEPELRAAVDRGLPVVRRAELLAELMRRRRGVAVAGTHGKTTTTALIGHLLTAAGVDPTIIVGGRAHFMGSHAKVGAGSWFVCEADEFDRSFLELNPDLAVITNLEPEHLDCYGDVAGLEAAFVSFANHTSAFGTVILCADNAGIWDCRHRIRREVIGYGASSEANLRMEIRNTDSRGTGFEVIRDGVALGEVFLSLPGRFNALNAMAAIAVALELEIDFSVIAEACADFHGVARRFEVKGERDGVTVVDDYAHHPTEIRALLEAARQAMPDRRMVAVFQPHLFSRTRDFAGDFASALMAADVAVVLPIYPAREQPIDGVSSRLVVDLAAELGHPNVTEGPPVAEASQLLEELLQRGDVMLTVGAGDVDRLATAWLEGGA